MQRGWLNGNRSQRNESALDSALRNLASDAAKACSQSKYNGVLFIEPLRFAELATMESALLAMPCIAMPCTSTVSTLGSSSTSWITRSNG